MMKWTEIVNPKFVVDQQGNRIGVFIDIREFDALIEKIEDAQDIASAEKILKKKEKTYPLDIVKKKILKKK